MKTTQFLIILFLLSGFIVQGQFEKNLVAHYAFENGKAKDYAGYGGRGKIYGDLKRVKGVNGDALYFNGGNQNIVFKGKVNRFLRGTRDFTISFYFRTDDINQRSSILGKRTECDGYKMVDLRLANGKLNAELYEQERPQIKNNISATIPNDKWHHYVYTRKGNTVRLFVDGLLQDSHQVPHIIPIDDIAYFGINVSPCRGINKTGNLHGTIDELKIFNIALSKKNVDYLFSYNNPLTYRTIRGRDTDTPKKETKQLDPRLNSIFGKYEDEENQSTLVIEPDGFILKIKNPKGYKAEELIYIGKYKIAAGDLYLLKGEISFINQEDESPQVMDFQEKVIGELYENGVDLFAFETRMQLTK